MTKQEYVVDGEQKIVYGSMIGSGILSIQKFLISCRLEFLLYVRVFDCFCI